MTPDKDRQQFHAIFASVEALLNYEDNDYCCELIDISLHGCLLHVKETWDHPNLEALYSLTLLLPDATPIVMNLSIYHAQGKEISFKCEHIDADDVSALSHFVQLNSAKSALLDRELVALTHCN